MATLAQLQAESYWSREVVTPELDWLGDELCRRTGLPRTAAGAKGNTVHLRGGHRSQEWLLHSRWCTDRRYTVQSGLSADQLLHVGATDFVPGEWGTAANRALMREQTGRLITAARAGRLDGVREVLGTLDGKTVTGLDVTTGKRITADDSHLDHWHLTFDRRRCHDQALMRRIVSTALGDPMAMLTDAEQAELLRLIRKLDKGLLSVGSLVEPLVDGKRVAHGVGYYVAHAQEDLAALADQAQATGATVTAIQAAVTGLAVPAPAPVDPDAVARAVLAAVRQPEVLEALARAVAEHAVSAYVATLVAGRAA